MPINILRVSSDSAPSGFLLYSGITTRTVMGPVNPSGQSGEESSVLMEDRATQTETNTISEKPSSSVDIRHGNCKRIGKQVNPRVNPHSCLVKPSEGRPAFTKYTRPEANLTPNRIRERRHAHQRQASNNDGDTSTISLRHRFKAEKTQTDSSLSRENHPIKSKQIATRVTEHDGNVSNNPIDGQYSTLDTAVGVVREESEKNKSPTESEFKENREDKTNILREDDHNQNKAEDVEKQNSQSLQELSALQPSDPKEKELPSSQSENKDNEEEKCLEIQRDKSPTAKTTYPPVISWQEASVDRKTPSSMLREIPVSVYSSMFETGMRPALQTAPHAPRVLIPPKHTCPEGLTSDDVILGVCINPESCLSGDTATPNGCFGIRHDMGHGDSQIKHNQDNKHLRRVQSAAVVSDRNPKDTTLTQNRPSTVHHGVIKRPATSSSIPSDKLVSLQLSIISLGPERHNQSKILGDTRDSDEIGDPPKSFSPSTPRLDTMEDIKRSYHRAQSAPPLASKRDNFQQSPINPQLRDGPTSAIDTNGSSDVRKFSSPYWRARSAYHRRNLDAKEAETSQRSIYELSSETAIGNESGQPKGTLLRPLLYTSENGLMRHGAGCPYKCKNCFRACLVSDDFAQKAQHRRQEISSKLREPRRKKNSYALGLSRIDFTTKGTHKDTYHRGLDARAIVQRALARSQPIYQSVYGGKDHPPIILPWPSYAWVDIKQKKTEKMNDMASRNKSVDRNDSSES